MSYILTTHNNLHQFTRQFKFPAARLAVVEWKTLTRSWTSLLPEKPLPVAASASAARLQKQGINMSDAQPVELSDLSSR